MELLRSEDELDRARALADELLNDCCTILSPPTSGDGLGGVSGDWPATATDVPCRLVTERRAVEVVEGGKIVVRMGYSLVLSVNQAINATQQVVVGGVTYQVTGLADEASACLVKHVSLERV